MKVKRVISTTNERGNTTILTFSASSFNWRKPWAKKAGKSFVRKRTHFPRKIESKANKANKGKGSSTRKEHRYKRG